MNAHEFRSLSQKHSKEAKLELNLASPKACTQLDFQVSEQTNELQPGFEGEEITLEESLGWLELGLWTTICLCPFLYFINGPSVSPNQAVVRTSLVVISILGAIGLRTYKILKSPRKTADS